MVNKIKYNSVEEIPVWKLSHDLTIYVYKLTKNFPNSEIHGLTSQFRRCIVSIPANISEGFYRKTIKELLQFLYISRGSLGESRYYVLLSKDLKYITEADYVELIKKMEVIGKQLNGWINSLQKYK